MYTRCTFSDIIAERCTTTIGVVPVVKTVLVADDDAMGLKLIEDIVTVAGYLVIAARDGRQAVEAARLHMPDLILMDVMMPVLDGYGAVAQLKSDVKTKDIPVVMITAVDSGYFKELAFSLGAVDYITKPFSVKHLISRISQHLTR